jgi:hypothetical protein
VREEEEGSRLGREVSWASREAEAQWGWGGNGRLERKKRAAAGPKVRMGRLAVGPVGPKVRKILFRIKFDFFEYTKALEICRRRFKWNFDMRIFPKIF